jgi:L-threonylcarbamoyladenylate synthase
MATKIYTMDSLGGGAERAALAGCFAAGGVAVFPTETFYGLGGDPGSAALLARVASLKERPPEQAVPLVAAHVEAARSWVNLSGDGEDDLWRLLAGACWPGPLTLVARARPGLAQGAVAPDGTLAVRVPGHVGARALAGLCGGLLVATSANRSGRPPAVLPHEAAQGLAGPVDCVVDGGRAPGGLPSTLVAIAGGRPRLLRDGAVPRRVLEEILGDRSLS